MALVVKRFEFSAAHKLPNYVGKCANWHGHTWTIEVGIKDFINKDTGMVVDFSKIKEGIDPLKESLDHHSLNDIIENPTAENIGVWILERLPFNSSKIKFVRVWESPDSYAEVTKEDLPKIIYTTEAEDHCSSGRRD